MRSGFHRIGWVLRLGVAGAALAGVGRAQTPLADKPGPVNDPRDNIAIKRLFDSWKAPGPPRHLVANIYYVGAIGISSYLITTPAGHILIDTGFDETVPIIQRGVEQLGFKVSDIKLLLSSHAHVDHVGGHARMQQLTGARIVASAADARVLATGGASDFIQWPRALILYQPVQADRIVADREQVTLGGVTLTANLTPGHTKGATTWTMDVTEAGRVQHVVFFSSVSINAGTTLVNNPNYPEIAEDFTAAFARLKTLP